MAGNFYAHSMYPYAGGDHHQPPQQPPPHHSGWGSGQIGFLSYGNAPEHHPTQSYIAEHMYPPPPPQHHHTYTNYSPFFSNPQQQQTPPPYPPPPPHQPIPDAFWANTNNVMHQMEPAPVQLETSKVDSSGIKAYSSSNANDANKNSGVSKAKQMSWATIASQPVKAPLKSIKSKLATAVLSATKPMPNTLASSSSPPSSASEEQENKSGEDAHISTSNNHNFDSNGSRDRPMQPTPEPTPAQAAEIIERQKKEQSQQNREQANLKNKASKNIDSKSNQNVLADRSESNQLSSKSSLNSSINSHRSNRDDTSSSQQRDKQNSEMQRETGPSDAYRNDNNQTINPKEQLSEIRDSTYRRDSRDYSTQNARDNYYRDNRDSRNLHRNHHNNNNQRDFYLRNDPINRRHDQNNRWEQQSTGRDSSRDRRDNRDFDNRTDHRDYSRDMRRDAYSNRNGSGRFSDVSSNHSNSAYNSRGHGQGYVSNYGSGQNQSHVHHQSHSNHHPHHPSQGQGGYPYNKNHQPNSSRPTNYNNNNNNKQINRSNANISNSNRQFNIPSRSSSTSLNHPSGRSLSKPNSHYSASSALSHSYPPLTEHQQRANEQEAQNLLDKLRAENNYNPSTFDTPSRSSRFFIIKSYSEDDVHRSIKYSIWCSTEHGNAKLDAAYRSRETLGPVYLLYSVNGSGHFCGVAQMLSPVDYNACSGVWSQDKWKGQFRVKWIYVKDVPNQALKHIILANNDYKPVTYSRDTQEVPHAQGCEVLDIIHSYSHTTSIFDDFLHYEKKQLEEQHYRKMQQQQESNQGDAVISPQPPLSSSASVSSNNKNHYDHQSDYNPDRHHQYRSNANRYHQSDRNRTLERPSILNRNSNNRSSSQQAKNDSPTTRESQSDKEQSDLANEPILNEKIAIENDESNKSESIDSSLAGACYKLNLESTIWADQWD